MRNISDPPSSDTVVVGAWKDDDVADNSGAAYVYVRVASAWTQQHKLTAADVCINLINYCRQVGQFINGQIDAGHGLLTEGFSWPKSTN
eukprot:COSAG01_NODE_58227_length_307_cov_0.932692_1_plen_88_part_01